MGEANVIERPGRDAGAGSPKGAGGGGGGGRPIASDGPTQPGRQALIDFLLDLEDELRDVSRFLRARFPAFEEELPRLHADVALAIAQLQHEALGDQLAAAELLGAPGAMKLAVRDAARGLGGAVRRAGTLVIDATRISLKAANVLLGSMLKLPGIEGIKEFKDAAEVGLDVVHYLSQADPNARPKAT